MQGRTSRLRCAGKMSRKVFTHRRSESHMRDDTFIKKGRNPTLGQINKLIRQSTSPGRTDSFMLPTALTEMTRCTPPA